MNFEELKPVPDPFYADLKMSIGQKQEDGWRLWVIAARPNGDEGLTVELRINYAVPREGWSIQIRECNYQTGLEIEYQDAETWERTKEHRKEVGASENNGVQVLPYELCDYKGLIGEMLLRFACMRRLFWPEVS